MNAIRRYLLLGLFLVVPLGLKAADFTKGETVRLSRDIPLLFNNTVYREASKGERFTVYLYNPAKQRIYVLTKNPQGQTIALNIAEDALIADNSTPAPQAPSSTPAPVSNEKIASGNEDPMTTVFAGAFWLGVVAAIFLLSKWGKRYTHMRRAKAYLNKASKTGSLPSVRTRLILKQGEAAVYDAPAILFETRSVREFQSGHIGFRVAKGVWIGGSRGRSISSQHWMRIDGGTLTVTNKRLVFEGRQESRNAVLSKITSATYFDNGVEIHVENKQKALAFTAKNPPLLVGIIRAANAINEATN
jgi:hypothetical protein